MTRTLTSGVFLLVFVTTAGCGIGDAQTQVRSAIDAKGAELNQCYAAALTRDRDESGMMQAYIHVDNQQGRISQVEFTGGDVQDPSLESCINDSLTQVQLSEPPAANLKIEYTFQLTPQG